MKKMTAICVAFISALMFSSCAGIITLKTPKITGGKIEKASYVAKKPPVLFDDFEAGTVVGGYSYANGAGGASAKIYVSDPQADKAHGGNYAAKVDIDTGADSSWGCGFGAQSTYGGGFIDANEREYVTLWINCPEGMEFYIFVNEAAANGADGEYWGGTPVKGTGKWTYFEFALDTFYKNIYSGNQSGNNVLDTAGIGTVGAQLAGAQGKGVFMFDDIWFK
ncbi:MAG: hypothetical protein LLG37_00780 [Spirochaetia bacterium]|nr:hypothetical protein [Spirochaetia bacterium]